MKFRIDMIFAWADGRIGRHRRLKYYTTPQPTLQGRCIREAVFLQLYSVFYNGLKQF